MKIMELGLSMWIILILRCAERPPSPMLDLERTTFDFLDFFILKKLINILFFLAVR